MTTPSHNPPADCGLKYSPPPGGPTDAATTKSIERIANDLLASVLAGVCRIPDERDRTEPGLHGYDYARLTSPILRMSST